MSAEGKMAELWQRILERNDESQWQSTNAFVRKHLKKGADVNYQQDGAGATCLMVAVRSENIELVSLLLEQPGIDVNAKNILGCTALHKAAIKSSPAIIRLLLDFPGIDREAPSWEGRTPLMESISYGSASQFAEFLKTPEILLNDARLPGFLETRPQMKIMFAKEQRKKRKTYEGRK